MDKENRTEVPFQCSITVIQESGDEGKSFTFDSKNWCVLGSHPDCDIRIKHSNSAPLHALVFVREDGVHLQGIDPEEPVVHSRSAKNLTREEELSLHSGDVFFLGDRGFRVEFEKISPSPPKTPLQTETRTIDAPIRIARGANSERKARRASRSARKTKPKRRVSLVVERHGERYVAQRGDSEKLLSRSQLARLSGGEGFHTSRKAIDEENESSISTQLSVSETSTTTERDGASSNEKAPLISSAAVVSVSTGMLNEESNPNSFRHTEANTKDKASVTEEGIKPEPITSEKVDAPLSAPHTPTNTKVERLAKSATKLSGRDRKNMVYARLSQGLSALPRKSEVVESTSSVAFCASSFSFNEHSGENNSFDQKTNADVNQISKSPIRSPLADKSPLLNIQKQPKLRGSITKECRTPSLSKKQPTSVLRSSKSTTKAKSRSVAFAARIELERGTHYSPFRPKQFPRTPVPKQGPATLSKKPALGSAGRPPKPMAPKDGLNAFEAKDENVDDNCLSGRRDGSTGNQGMKQTTAVYTALSRTDRRSKQQQESSTSGLKGAITSFIKRLSGNVDDSDESDNESIDEQSSDIRDSRRNLSTDTVMTTREIEHLARSNRMSTTRRLSFFDKVLGAAAAVRQITTDAESSDSSLSVTHEAQIGSSGLTGLEENDVRGGLPSDFVVTPRCSDLDTQTMPEESPDGQQSTIDENQINEMPKNSPLSKIEGHAAIFQKLSGREEISECNCPLDQKSDHSDETASLGFNSDDSHSVDSQDTADTFERDLEIAVTQGSAPSPYAPAVSNDPSQTFREDGEADNATQECQHGRGPKTHDQGENGVDFEAPSTLIPDGIDSAEMQESKLTATDEESHSDGQSQPHPETRPKPQVHHSVQRKMRRSGRLSSITTCDRQSLDGNSTTHQPNAGSDQHATSENDSTGEVTGDRTALQASLNKLLVVDLRKRLRELNLSAAGKKAELVNRLVAHLLLTSSSSEETKNIEESNDIEVVEIDKEAAAVIKCVSDSQQKDGENTVAESTDGEFEDKTTTLDSDYENGKEVPEVDENVNIGKNDIIDAYRRKTVKELRNILRDNNLDIMSKLRKEELIHHMVSLNLQRDVLPVEANQTPRPERVLRSTRTGRQTPAAGRSSKKS